MSDQYMLADAQARVSALVEHNRSLLVEAGAGSGKTAVMAGRVVMMLAEGVAPASIAAVTFTEMAAGELLQRVRDFAQALCDGAVPPELKLALPDGLGIEQGARLQAAMLQLDELTCSTIHGFCQRLIMPYPVEAGIDPGAGVLPAAQADAVFSDLLELWLREELDKPDGGCLAPFLAGEAGAVIGLVRKVAGLLRNHRQDVTLPSVQAAGVPAWRSVLAGFVQAFETAGIAEDKCRNALAAATAFGVAMDAAHSPAALLALPLPEAMFNNKGEFKALRNKVDWVAAAKLAGIGKKDAEASLPPVVDAYKACGEVILALREQAAGAMLAGMVQAVRPILDRYAQHKRNAAQLDFDDLIFSARALLRDHEAVRQELARRYAYLLVDEFQDTDAMQAEIFWTLCGEADSAQPGEWRARRIRPGALFLVGDPKQAIYRFRGADIRVYLAAREAFLRHDPDSVLSIATNFRSDAPILSFVNERFDKPLSQAGQPGFVPLEPHNADTGLVSVMALDLPAEEDAAAVVRQAEAEAVAEICHRLIGHYQVRDRGGKVRSCRASDIALLAPSGTGLWCYEAALEHRGIAVVSQAGKGFYRQQEVQDLVALVRVLADARDTLALGALLRGPLVGLSDQDLLDIAWSLQQRDPPIRLSLFADPDLVGNALARGVLWHLRYLNNLARTTTPALLLAEALARLRVRHVVMQRHGGQAERQLANIQQFADMAGDYAVRGLAAFAADVSAAWTDGASVREGGRDTDEDAVTLFTMHASKGLEWLIVIPVNSSTKLMAAESEFVERSNGRIHCKVMDVMPPGYEEAQQRETDELARERVRLWYVAVTRARQLLVLPRGVPASEQAWNGVVNLDSAKLPALDLPEPNVCKKPTASPVSSQPTDQFRHEAAVIQAAQRVIRWRNPSRGEGWHTRVIVEESAQSRIDMDYTDNGGVRGSRDRGLIIHKLLEEVITGETEQTLPALAARAQELADALGADVNEDSNLGLSPAEMSDRVAAALALPDIVPLLPTLQAEYPLWGSGMHDGEEHVTAGIADAVSVGADGRPRVVIDWKSDVAPSAQVLAQYREQVAAYVAMAGAERGLVVLVTTGQVIEV